jgi:hypothetical protein
VQWPCCFCCCAEIEDLSEPRATPLTIPPTAGVRPSRRLLLRLKDDNVAKGKSMTMRRLDYGMRGLILLMLGGLDSSSHPHYF